MMGVRRDNMMKFGCNRSMCASPIAIAIGVFMGYVFGNYYPYGSFDSYLFTTTGFSKVSTSNCEVGVWVNSMKDNMMKANKVNLMQKNAELRQKVGELDEKLKFGDKPKAGPFGTVKGLRTNPTVVPDESVNPRLSKILKVTAIDKELIVVLANSNAREKLELQVSTVKKVGIHNYLVVALDNDIESYCKTNGVAVYKPDLDDEEAEIGKNGPAYRISGLKFRILREFLQLGYSVLLSDVDIIYLQNPFEHLYRDSDVESMTDGHDSRTAYGYQDIFDDPTMGWSRYVHTNRIWVYNSGFFYIRPTIPAIELLDRVTDRLSKEEAWDQAVFNEVMFYPSHLGYEGLHASKRTMDFYSFMNSRVLFKTVRKDPNLKKFKPVIIHINYHPDKVPRMKAVIEYYVNGKLDALDHFPDGTKRDV